MGEILTPMRPPCQHSPRNPACPDCRRYAADPAFRAWCARLPPPKPAPPPPRTVSPGRKVDCVHLGKKLGLESSCRGLCFHACEGGRGVAGKARPGVECQRCDGYEADE
jgi:hypothetical protein